MVRQCWSGSPRQSVRGRCRHQSRLRFYEGLPSLAGFGGPSATRGSADRSPLPSKEKQLNFPGRLLVAVPGGGLGSGPRRNRSREKTGRRERLGGGAEATEKVGP